MYGNFRAATLNEYITWLKGYMAKGGAPTHYYNFPFSKFGRFLYVTGMFGLEGEVGSAACHIILDKDAELDPRKSDLGHTVLLYMVEYRRQDKPGSPTRWEPTFNRSQDRNGSPALWIPIFNNDEFRSISGIDPHLKRLVAEDAAERERRRRPDCNCSGSAKGRWGR